jgi:hypothetical protein
MTWNVLPNWQPPRIFSSRYEWQKTQDYAQNLSGPYAEMMNAGASCDMNRYGEVNRSSTAERRRPKLWADVHCAESKPLHSSDRGRDSAVRHPGVR